MDIYSAIQSSNMQALEKILREDPDQIYIAHESGITAIMMACYRKQAKMAKMIATLTPKLNFSEQIAMGYEGKIVVAVKDNPSILKQFSPDGFAPIHYAAFFKQAYLLNLFITYGADIQVKARNHSRVHPIHTAVAAGDYACIKLLCDAGCDLDVKQEGGWTPLMAVAKQGRSDLVQLLLESKPDILLRSDSGKSAVSLANTSNHPEITQLLKKHYMKIRTHH